VVVPFQPEDYGAQGIGAIQEAIAQVRSHSNPGLKLLGYLLTMVRKVGLHQAFERELRKLYGSDVFQTNVPRAIAFAEAVAARVPITRWKPRSPAALVIHMLAREIEERVKALSSSFQGAESLPDIAAAGGTR
jgi:chromosome partitioning protein